MQLGATPPRQPAGTPPTWPEVHASQPYGFGCDGLCGKQPQAPSLHHLPWTTSHSNPTFHLSSCGCLRFPCFIQLDSPGQRKRVEQHSNHWIIGWLFLLGGGFKYFLFLTISPFHLYLGKIPILTNIFQRGWHHRLVWRSQRRLNGRRWNWVVKGTFGCLGKFVNG